MDERSTGTDVNTLLARPSSRRGFLKGVAAVSTAAAGLGVMVRNADAQAADTAQDILNIAATAEALAVTFYSGGVTNAGALGLNQDEQNYFIAAAIEEQLHYNFLTSNGAKPAATTFSVPGGPGTFTDLAVWLSTQQQLEIAFVSAYLAAVNEFGAMNQPDLARYAYMIGLIEAEHFSLGRTTAEGHNVTFTSTAPSSATRPADPWGFAPQLVPTVGDAVGFLQQNGYLSPSGSNSFSYSAIDFTSSTYATIYGQMMYTTPTVATS